MSKTDMCERLERERVYWKDAYSECKARIAELINDEGGSDDN